ncbi:hypothetical protein EGH21_14920 [Halomicroarcula sp. F13]|uniref:Sulfatase-like protein n=1 Tax=Haloarcula rubra TaxID=2487747 RepID=A0AAW4PUX5_9EURY|nr:hypothetical protein [Halomicroarcula rubra]MBX0324320.1 hypothetical protein [Halomicroarcula rubra]
MQRPRSSLSEQVRWGLREPHLVVRRLNEFYFDLQRQYGDQQDRVDFFDEDWDNLLLLDACRYDTFADVVDLPGTLEHRHSRSSSTIEFLNQYFDGRDLTDTVYVTANPQHYRKSDREFVSVDFHDVVEIWQEDGWDETFRTVRPETVADATERAAEQYPNKRLLVHFLQPHYPYIGPTGQEHFDNDSLDFFNRVMNGEVDIDDEILWEAYRENLDVVVPHVERLLDSLRGKTVVSADHGEMFGERAFPLPMREYGHPSGIHTEELTKIPWHVYDEGPRKDIVEGNATATETDDVASEVVEERLRDLGYA